MIRATVPLLALLWLTAGCRSAAAPAVPTSAPASGLRDWVRHPQVAPDEADSPSLRLLCASPAMTETCCALGLRAQIVGRTRYCDYPPEIAEVPSIGALIDTNVEMLLSLQPDLTLVSGSSRAIRERLDQINLRHECLPDVRLDDIFESINRVGELTDRPRTAAQLSTALRGELEQVRRQYSTTTPARVLLLIGTLNDPPFPPFVAGPGSFYDDLLKLAGHANIAEEARQRAFGPLALEFILAADPDVIIELDPDGRARPNGAADAVRVWSQLGPLRAVTAGRIHVLVGNQHYLPGPRVAFTFEALCRAIAGAQP